MNRHANPVEFVGVSKLIRRKVCEDHEKFRTERLLKTIEERRSLKKCERELRQQIATTNAIKAHDGTRLTNRVEIEHRVEEFYTSLFSSKKTIPLDDDYREEADIPQILISEMQTVVKTLKADKAPCPDGITNEALKSGGYELWQIMTNLFNECLENEDIPTQWKKSTIIILQKKGDREDLKN
jgi:hypothetical protein